MIQCFGKQRQSAGMSGNPKKSLSEGRGHRFESCRARQQNRYFLNFWGGALCPQEAHRKRTTQPAAPVEKRVMKKPREVLQPRWERFHPAQEGRAPALHGDWPER